jgi:hypothetical protein
MPRIYDGGHCLTESVTGKTYNTPPLCTNEMNTDIETLRRDVAAHFLGRWDVTDFSFVGLCALSTRLLKESTARWPVRHRLLQRFYSKDIRPGERFTVTGEAAAERLAYLKKRVAGLRAEMAAVLAKKAAAKKAWEERIEAAEKAEAEAEAEAEAGEVVVVAAAPEPEPEPITCEADELRAALARGVIRRPAGETEEWDYTFLGTVVSCQHLLENEMSERDADTELVALLYLTEMREGAVWNEEEIAVADPIISLEAQRAELVVRIAHADVSIAAYEKAAR